MENEAMKSERREATEHSEDIRGHVKKEERMKMAKGIILKLDYLEQKGKSYLKMDEIRRIVIEEVGFKEKSGCKECTKCGGNCHGYND